MRNIKLEELMGSLRTFEMNFKEERSGSRGKGIVLKTEADSNEVETKFDEDEDLAESMALLTKNLGRVMNGLNRRSNGSGPGNSENTRNFNPQRKNRMQIRNQIPKTGGLGFSAESVMGLVIFNQSVPTSSRKTISPTTSHRVMMILMEAEVKGTMSVIMWLLQFDPI